MTDFFNMTDMADGTFSFGAAPLVLAQDGGVGPPSTAMPGTSAAPAGGGTGGGGGGGAAPGGLGATPMVMMAVLIVAMVVMSTLGGRREKKKRETLMNSLKKHDRVQTSGGIIGAIVEIKPDTVVLKVDESSNTRIRFSRGAIQQVIAAGEDARSTE